MLDNFKHWLILWKVKGFLKRKPVLVTLTRKKSHKMAHFDQLEIWTLTREWLESTEPDDYIYKMVLLDIKNAYPKCKMIQKGKGLSVGTCSYVLHQIFNL